MHGSLKTTAGAPWLESTASRGEKGGAPCAGTLRVRAQRSLAGSGDSSWGMYCLAASCREKGGVRPTRACIRPAHAALQSSGAFAWADCFPAKALLHGAARASDAHR